MRAMICLLTGWLLASHTTAQPHVLVSIKPLQLIAQALVTTDQSVGVLLPAGATPHHYTMRPSDLSRLGDTDIIVWLGAAAEQYLDKAIVNSSGHAEVVSLEKLLKEREGGYVDPHLWLSGQRAIQVAQLITDRLVKLDPDNGDDYLSNLAAFIGAVEEQEELIRTELKSFSQAAYLVYHDAYRYFEEDYGIMHRDVVTQNPEVSPGIRQLTELDRLIATNKISCILVEPESNHRIVDRLANKHDLRIQLIDPMASDLLADGNSYVRFLGEVTNRIKNCLEGRVPRDR